MTNSSDSGFFDHNNTFLDSGFSDHNNTLRKMKDYFPEKHLPNMGVYGCFLGNGYHGEGSTYFGHPVFIYFQSFMLVLFAV